MCPFEELYRLTFADAGLPPPTPEQFKMLWELDASGWTKTISSRTLVLMKDLKAIGKKIGILSNMSEDFHERLFAPRCAEHRALADAEIISGFEKLVKPDRPIYDLAAERIGIAPGDLLFLDDTESNVLAARKWGWRSHVYRAES
jgi:FMN phosphatase YigB (HAD superfamily)